MPASAPGSRTGRRWLLRAAALVVVLALGELTAFAVLSVRAGEVVTFGVLDAQRDEVVGAASGAVAGLPEPAAEAIGPERLRAYQALHPFTGYVRDPSDFPVALGTDPVAAEYGFPRNHASPFSAAGDDDVVIAITGGSVASAFAEHGGPVLVERLAAVERFRGRSLTVLNLALTGYKQPQQLMVLNWFLSLGAEIDVVVNLDGFNELALPIAENLPHGVFPFFPRGWQFRVGHLSAELRERIGELAVLHDERAARAEWFGRAPLRYSMIAALVWQSLDRRSAARIAALALEHGPDPADPTAEYQAHGPRFEPADDAELMDRLVGFWLRCSLQMERLCQGLGIEYYHVLQPNQYLRGSKRLTPQERSTAFQANHPYRPAVVHGYPRLIAAGRVLQSLGVSFHDLTRVYAEVDETVYADTCCHLNERGHRLLAEAVAAVVAEGTGLPSYEVATWRRR